jgi:hypothetical protein
VDIPEHPDIGDSLALEREHRGAGVRNSFPGCWHAQDRAFVGADVGEAGERLVALRITSSTVLVKSGNAARI